MPCPKHGNSSASSSSPSSVGEASGLLVRSGSIYSEQQRKAGGYSADEYAERALKACFVERQRQAFYHFADPAKSVTTGSAVPVAVPVPSPAPGLLLIQQARSTCAPSAVRDCAGASSTFVLSSSAVWDCADDSANPVPTSSVSSLRLLVHSSASGLLQFQQRPTRRLRRAISSSIPLFADPC